ncbi:MAG TPA: response regulator transcription factor [Tissierellales bacterium]|nr:response regulator transcription factor [Tissierellales bacterium]
MSSKNITVIIVDDHALMREGLMKILEMDDNIDVIGEASNGKEGMEKILEYKPDIVLLDINMPKMNGVEVLRRAKDLGLESKIIMLTIHDDREYLQETIRIGANGYVLKDSDVDSLIKAIKDVSKGKTYIQPSIAILLIDEMNEEDNEVAMKIESLTKREYEILIVIAEGLNNREIAERLFISEKTVKNHVSNIFRKLEVNDRIQAAIFAFKNNIKKI